LEERAIVLVGLDDELSVITRTTASARQGRGGLVIIDAAAGSGKTALLDAVVGRERERGMTVLYARGSGLEADFAFGVVRQLFEPAIPLAPRWPVDNATHESLHQLFLVVRRRAEQSPLLIVVDDVHLADEPSLRWLAHLALRLDTLPVALLVTIRTAERRSCAAYASLVEDPRQHRIRLGPLRVGDLSQLVATVLGHNAEEQFRDACHAATNGNPLLVRKLLKAMAERGVRPLATNVALVIEVADRVRVDVVIGLLNRRAGPVLRVAKALAVLGDNVEHEVVAQLCDLTAPDVGDALTALMRDGLLRSVQPIRFAHRLLPGAVLAAMPLDEKKYAHIRAAQLLADHGVEPERIAGQLLDVPPATDPRAVAMLLRAARAASKSGRFELAATFLRRARQEPMGSVSQTAEILYRLGTAELAAGLPGASAHLRQALRLGGTTVRRAMVAGRLAEALHAEGRAADLTSVLTTAWTELGEPTADEPAGTLESRQALQSELIGHAFYWPEPAKIVSESQPGRPAEATGRTAIRTLFDAAQMNLDAHQAREAVEKALRGRPGTAADAISGAVTLVLADCPAEAIQMLDGMSGRAVREVTPVWSVREWMVRSEACRCGGNLPTAYDWVRSAFDRVQQKRDEPDLPVCAALLTGLLLARGELDEAEALLRSCSSASSSSRSGWGWAMMLASWGGLWAARGQPRAALAAFLAAGDHAKEWPFTNPSMLPWRSAAALVHVELGNLATAGDLAEEQLELARRWGSPRPLGTALRALAAVSGGNKVVELLGEAVGVLTGTPARLELAMVLIDLGVTLRAQEKKETARELLRHAMDLAQLCGATAVADRAYVELVATGGRPRRVRQSGPAALTQTERQVACLAAQGRSNREIAQSLFVTQRAVERMLTGAYRKLGVAGRCQLAEVLGDQVTEVDPASLRSNSRTTGVQGLTTGRNGSAL
jgi:DNA-binding CsgD family transcriptional regulator/tetratricopeptide (TPR) repeat protein